MKAPIPGGVWAVASGLDPARELDGWLRAAAPAAALTWRRPQAGERDAIGAARRMAAQKWLAVHGRGDWAMAAGAQAVIAGHQSLAVAMLRDLFPDLLVGCSVHDEEECARAAADGAHFLVFGPVFDTPSKRGLLEPRGAARLAAACAHGLPVIAIGGILAPEQAAECRAAGAHAVAVLRAAREPGLLARLVAGF